MDHQSYSVVDVNGILYYIQNVKFHNWDEANIVSLFGFENPFLAFEVKISKLIYLNK